MAAMPAGFHGISHCFLGERPNASGVASLYKGEKPLMEALELVEMSSAALLSPSMPPAYPFSAPEHLLPTSSHTHLNSVSQKSMWTAELWRISACPELEAVSLADVPYGTQLLQEFRL